jgi:hypothetical protein
MEDDKTEVQPWDKVAEETDEQYDWFVNYYLPMGYRRSVRSAYASYVVKNNPEGAARLGKQLSRHSPWIETSIDFEWYKRAVAYDESVGETALQAVKQAQLNLKLATVDAVDALITNLTNPRLAVAAAKEILDRGGIPGRAINENITTVHISADEMAEAAKEVQEWEKSMLDESGSSASEV